MLQGGWVGKGRAALSMAALDHAALGKNGSANAGKADRAPRFPPVSRRQKSKPRRGRRTGVALSARRVIASAVSVPQ